MHHRKNFIVAFVYYYSCTYEMLNWLKEGWFNVCSVQCIVSVFHLDFIVFSFEAIREMRENSNIIQWSAKKTNNLKLIYSYHSGSIESSVSFNFSFSISTMKHTPLIKILCSMNEFNLNWCYRLRYMHYVALFLFFFFSCLLQSTSSLTPVWLLSIDRIVPNNAIWM